MDSSVSVISNPVIALVAFLGVIVLLLFLIAKWRWHVFLALLAPLLLFGFIPGVQQNNFVEDSEVYIKMIKYWDYLSEYRKLKREILNSVNKVFESGTLLFGQELKKFEKKFFIK